MGAVVVEQLVKDFSGVTVLQNINLDIEEGEFSLSWVPPVVERLPR